MYIQIGANMNRDRVDDLLCELGGYLHAIGVVVRAISTAEDVDLDLAVDPALRSARRALDSLHDEVMK